MNVEYFISKRLFTAKEGNNRYTKPILNIAILAIALSLSMMLISIMIVSGFKQEISDKVIGFTSHITIVNYTDNQSYESEPVNINQDFYPSIINKEGVRHIQVFATKAGIVKTEEEILGTVLKGVGSDFNSLFFHQNLIEGEVPIYNDTATSNYVMISKKVSDLLSLKIEDKLIMYFVDDPPRVRKFIIHGIYETGFNDFDELVVLGDIKHIQKLNQWDSNQVGGFEIMLDDFDNIDEITDQIYEEIDYNIGGGAGGLIYMPGYPVTPGGTLTITVGCGGGNGKSGTKPVTRGQLCPEEDYYSRYGIYWCGSDSRSVMNSLAV